MPAFATAEWGFALGSPFWGTGVFQDGAELVLEFAFETLGVHRLEARAAMQNGRGNGALSRWARFRSACCASHSCTTVEYLDQVLYAILEDDWRAMRMPADLRFAAPARVH